MFCPPKTPYWGLAGNKGICFLHVYVYIHYILSTIDYIHI